MVLLTSCCVNDCLTISKATSYRRLRRTSSALDDYNSDVYDDTTSSVDHSDNPCHRPRQKKFNQRRSTIARPLSVSVSSQVIDGPDCNVFDSHRSPDRHQLNEIGAENTVFLKVSILGDPQTGKTSFMAKYVWMEKTTDEYLETIGVGAVEKVLRVHNSINIAFSIWDLGGHWQCDSVLPMVCRNASAILITFDLTRRSTLESVKEWFLQARECNKAAVPVIIGTKYDCFVEMPRDMQLAIIGQARLYAAAMGASLFFSSAMHNINVHKIFKVVVAKNLRFLTCRAPSPRTSDLGSPLLTSRQHTWSPLSSPPYPK